MRREFAAVSDR